MKRRIVTLAIVTGVALAGMPASAQTPTPTPAACGSKPPVITEREQLVERKLFFHGESAVGDVDGFGNFLGADNPQKMNTTAPTGGTPKADVNASKSVYPATLPGNPIMTAWHTTIDAEPLRIACYEFNFWAIGDGADMNVMVWPDSEFILGTGARAESFASGTGSGIVHYTGRYKPSRALLATSELYAQIEAGSPATLLYDSTAYPSSVTLVLIEPKPPAE